MPAFVGVVHVALGGHQHGQLGPETLPVPGRPYALHPSDQVQIRRTIAHPEHGQLRNGTIALVANIDPDAHTVSLRLADRRTVTLDSEQSARADLRLAYVQHPFPAQGQTTDTAHLIIAEHATQEGSYVALTRAREQTHIHAASPADPPSDVDRLQALSERMSRTEPDLPSIHTPLAHENGITTELARTSTDAERNSVAAQLASDRTATSASMPAEPRIPAPAARGPRTPEAAREGRARDHAPTQLERDPEISPEPGPAADRAPSEMLDEQPGRAWPRTRHTDPATPRLADDQPEHDHRHGWEP